MLRRFDPPVLALFLSLAFSLGAVACSEPETTTPELRADESEMQTVSLEITVPEGLTPEQVQAIASTAEGLAGGETAGAKVMARQTDEGAMSLTLQLWGPNLPAPELIVSQLQAEHPILAELSIDTELSEGVPDDEPMIAPDPDETPEQTEARITDELRAQGVEGEISVEVIDEGEGQRRVEVHVENDEKVEDPEP